METLEEAVALAKANGEKLETLNRKLESIKVLVAALESERGGMSENQQNLISQLSAELAEQATDLETAETAAEDIIEESGDGKVEAPAGDAPAGDEPTS